jgi:hypothetical protein
LLLRNWKECGSDHIYSKAVPGVTEENYKILSRTVRLQKQSISGPPEYKAVVLLTIMFGSEVLGQLNLERIFIHTYEYTHHKFAKWGGGGGITKYF